MQNNTKISIPPKISSKFFFIFKLYVDTSRNVTDVSSDNAKVRTN